MCTEYFPVGNDLDLKNIFVAYKFGKQDFES